MHNDCGKKSVDLVLNLTSAVIEHHPTRLRNWPFTELGRMERTEALEVSHI